jgi:molybdopterin-binding protein
VNGESLAKYLAKRDRSTTGAIAARQSMRNRLSGIVTRVVKDKVAAQVEIQVGAHRVVSLLTREAVDTLGLASRNAGDRDGQGHQRLRRAAARPGAVKHA